jgi:hypothetical protein
MEPRHAAAHDAAHALIVAVHEATRFWDADEAGGAVRELRREALAAASAVVAAASAVASGASGDAEVSWALALLERLERAIEVARERGVLDMGYAVELQALRATARLRLEGLEVREEVVPEALLVETQVDLAAVRARLGGR